MKKDVMNIKVSDIFEGFPDFEQQQKPQQHSKIVHVGDNKPRGLNIKETNIFHRKKHEIMPTIYSRFDDDETLHGARGLNAHLPSYLDRHTKDADVFTPTPRKEAMEAEQALDNMMGFNAFYHTPAEHEGTWKVKAHATDETYADYTKPPKNLKREKIGNYFYPTISYIEQSLRRTLADPTASHRHAKDQDALNRIQIYKRRIY